MLIIQLAWFLHYVVAAPQVVTHPTNTSAAAPFSAFNCSVQTYGKFTVTWYRNNRIPIPNKAYSTLLSSVNVITSVLFISNVTIKDVGRYYCEVRANRKAAESLIANLFLAGNVSIGLCAICSKSEMLLYYLDSPSPPVVMTVPVVNLTINNYNLTMKCLPDKDNFNYKWIKKNEVLPLRAQGVNTSQLTIVNIKPQDSGDYQCVMSNSTGTITSNFSTVNINGKTNS